MPAINFISQSKCLEKRAARLFLAAANADSNAMADAMLRRARGLSQLARFFCDC
jgi:hypothetical protein